MTITLLKMLMYDNDLNNLSTVKRKKKMKIKVLIIIKFECNRILKELLPVNLL
jgi:hypothetical protein